MDKPEPPTNPVVMTDECEVCHGVQLPPPPGYPNKSRCTQCGLVLCPDCKVYYEHHRKLPYPHFCKNVDTICMHCLKTMKEIPAEISSKIGKGELDYYPGEDPILTNGDPDFNCTPCGTTDWHGSQEAIGHYMCASCGFGQCKYCYEKKRVLDYNDPCASGYIIGAADRFFKGFFKRCIKCCAKHGAPENRTFTKEQEEFLKTFKDFKTLDSEKNKKRGHDDGEGDDCCEQCGNAVDESRSCPNCGRALCAECDPDFKVLRCRANVRGKKRVFGKRNLCNAYFGCTECIEEGEPWKCPDHQE